MRTLETHDVFTALRIVNRAGLKDKIKELALRINNGEKLSQEEVGFELIFDAISGCSNPATESDIYELLGGILEVEPHKVRTMDPMKLIEELKKLREVISIEDWKAFFRSLSAVMR